MSLTKSVADVLDQPVVLTVESIDRRYLSVIQPRLQIEKQVAGFCLFHRRKFFVKELPRLTRDFVSRVERFAQEQRVPLVTFAKDQRKEDVVAEYRAKPPTRDGVRFIGKAQEKASVPRISTQTSNTTGRTIPWLTKQSVMVNHFDFSCVDEDFGPFFLKFCSYFPYNARQCLNGHVSQRS